MWDFRKIIFVVILSGIGDVLYSQTAAIDSFNLELKRLESQTGFDADSSRIVFLREVSWELSNFNLDTAMQVADKAFKLADELDWEMGLAGIYELRGILYEYKSDYNLALEQHQRCLEIYQELNYQEGLAKTYRNIGVTYQDMVLYPEALKYHFKALKIDQKLDNKSGIASSYGNIGIVYLNQEDFEKALKYFNKSLNLFESINSPYGMAQTYGVIGNTYAYQNDFDKALRNYREAILIHEEMDNKIGMANTYGNIGNIYLNKGETHIALEHYLKSLAIFEQLGSKNELAGAYGNVGALYTTLKKYDLAERYIQKSLELAEQIGALNELRQAHQSFADLYTVMNKPAKALEHYRKFILFRDSILSEENIKESMQQEMQFEYEKRATKDSVEHANQKKLDDAEIVRQDAELEAKNTQTYFLFIGLSLVLVFALMMYNRFRVTNRQKEIIEQKEKETQQQKEVIEEKQKEIIDSINYAQRLQQAILAPESEIKKYLPESFLLYKPKDIVAGDFYFFEVTDSHIFYAAADCTGHGVPGAMVSIVCSNALSRCVKEFGLTDPGKILDKTRELILETFQKSGQDVKDGMDISLCVLKVNATKLNMKKATNFEHSTFNIEQISWAGANNPLWYIENGGLVEIKPDKQPIGKSDNPQPFTTYKLNSLAAASSLFLFTDGYVDQFGGSKGKKFKHTGLKNILLDNYKSPPEEINKILINSFYEWKGELEQVDDVCIIGIKI